MLKVDKSFESVVNINDFGNGKEFIEEILHQSKYNFLPQAQQLTVAYGDYGRLLYNPQLSKNMAVKLPKYVNTSFFETEFNYFSQLASKDLPIAKVLGVDIIEDALLVEYIKGKSVQDFTEEELISKVHEFADFLMAFIDAGVMPLIADKHDIIYSEEHNKFILVDLCKFYDVSMTRIRLPFVLSYFDKFRLIVVKLLNELVKEKLNVNFNFVVDEYYNFHE